MTGYGAAGGGGGGGRGDEAVGAGAQPQLGLVGGQHAEQHVRHVRAGQVLVRRHRVVFARGAPLGGRVAAESLALRQLLLMQGLADIIRHVIGCHPTKKQGVHCVGGRFEQLLPGPTFP